MISIEVNVRKPGGFGVGFFIPTNALCDAFDKWHIPYDISVKDTGAFFPLHNDELTKRLCERLLPDDKLADINTLCERYKRAKTSVTGNGVKGFDKALEHILFNTEIVGVNEISAAVFKRLSEQKNDI